MAQRQIHDDRPGGPLRTRRRPPTARRPEALDRGGARPRRRRTGVRALLVAVALAALLAACGGLAAAAPDVTAAADAGAAASAQDGDDLSATIEVRPEDPMAGMSVALDGRNSTGAIERYGWSIHSVADGETLREVDTEEAYYSYEFDEGGTYRVELTVEGQDGATDSTSRTIEVRPEELVARLSLGKSEPLVGEPLPVHSIDTTGNVTASETDFDGGETLVQVRPSESFLLDAGEFVAYERYQEPGDYTLSHTVENETGARHTDRESLTVRPEAENATLEAGFETRPVDQANWSQFEHTVEFDASDTVGEAQEYWWEFGEGQVVPTEDPVTEHDFVGNGSYDVRLIVVGPNATDAVERAVVVGQSIHEANLSVDASLSDPTPHDTLQFTVQPAFGTVEEFHWDFGDGTTEETTGRIARHAYEEPGTYELEVTLVRADGEEATVTRTVEVVESDSRVEISASPEPAQAGRPVAFEASLTNVSGSNLEWEFGDGTSRETFDSQERVWHPYEEPGTYTVTVTAGRYPRETVARTNVTIEPAANASELDAAVDATTTTPMEGLPVAFDAGATTDDVDAYFWRIEDPYVTEPAWQRTTDPTTTHTFYGTGSFDATLIAVSGDAADSASVRVEVQAEPDEFPVVEPSNPAPGEPITFSVPGVDAQASDFVWTFDDGNSVATAEDASTIQTTYDEPGTYDVEVQFVDVTDRHQSYSTTVTVGEPDDGGDGSDDGGDDAADDGGDDGPSAGGGSLGGIGSSDDGDAAETAPEFDVADVSIPDAVDEGAALTATVAVENVGDAAGTADVVVGLGDDESQASVAVEDGERATVDVTLLAPGEAGAYDLTASAGADESTRQLTVEGEGATEDDDDDAGESADDGDEQPGDDGDDDATPGFGALPALLALVAAAFARHRAP